MHKKGHTTEFTLIKFFCQRKGTTLSYIHRHIRINIYVIGKMRITYNSYSVYFFNSLWDSLTQMYATFCDRAEFSVTANKTVALCLAPNKHSEYCVRKHGHCMGRTGTLDRKHSVWRQRTSHVSFLYLLCHSFHCRVLCDVIINQSITLPSELSAEHCRFWDRLVLSIFLINMGSMIVI